MAHRARGVTTPIILGAAALALSACASNTALLNPRYPARLPQAQDGAHSQAQRTPHGGPLRSDPDHRGGTWKPYQVNGQWYYPAAEPDYDQVGIASWYGDAFNGRPTADGEIFDMQAYTAAHKTLPLPSIVEVTNLDNGRSMQLRLNDRGPFVGDRLIDLSKGAADKLGVLRPGLARVRVRYVGPAPDGPAAPPEDKPWRDNDVQYASATPPPRTVKPQSQPQHKAVLPPIPGTLAKLDDATLQPLSAPDPDDTALAVAETPAAAVQDAPRLPTASPVVAEAAPAGRFAIQAGSFSSRANAEKCASQLASVGQTEISPTERNGAILYRVFVHMRGQATADNALSQVAANGYRDAKIITAE
jgi:rare lipoprotein A